ncbi:CbtA family protein [Nonomuraea sp. NPDC049607]|uniref:CbtA family protein n=1 Tax=Nonomuraea sp. NPDC049607 TaxID=3154732 RepID=UPI00344A5FDC
MVAFLIPVVAARWLLPTVNGPPEGFPATLPRAFRLAAIGPQSVFWTAFGMLFGWASVLLDQELHRCSHTPEMSSRREG